VSWTGLFRSTTRILGWLEAYRSSDTSPYLRSSSARDLVDAVRPDLVSCGIEVPDVRRHPAESFLEPFDAMVTEVAETAAPHGV